MTALSLSPSPLSPISTPSFTCKLHPSPSVISYLTSSNTRSVFLKGRNKRLLCLKSSEEEKNCSTEHTENQWGKVSAVLFDMDGVLCNSEEPSRLAAVELFLEMGVEVVKDDFIPFMGTGEANFLGGVAALKGVEVFDVEVAKKRFFEIYLDKYAKPDSGIGFSGALELIVQCKQNGLKVAVASSADRVKVDANLAATGLPPSIFDAIISADAFENLKPAPDIFLAAAKSLNVLYTECIVIEDALAGVQAAKAAEMRCIAVTTTLSEELLAQAEPSLIRKEIGYISLQDILNGGAVSDLHHEKRQGSLKTNPVVQTTSWKLEGESADSANLGSNKALSFGGLQGTRREILRYASLGVSVSCLIFLTTNWKAMQFVSPKAILKLFFGVGSPPFGKNEGGLKSARTQQFVSYISDLEASGSGAFVPEFPSKLDWLNTAPLQFHKDLQGKVVLLDFWTYCCINCMHVLPDLEYLEKKYKDQPFTVVGVHSAKFDNEKDLEAIRSAVLRYDITHPVVNDGDMTLWRELGISSWPTFTLVGPNGKVLAQIAGEGHRKDLDELVEAALIFYGEKNMLQDTPVPLSLEKDNDPRLFSSPLKFPGKLAVDVSNSRLFISDSNHNRIVVTDLDGNFIIQVGSSGEEGLLDGNFNDATFNRPQGLAYNPKKNVLYVADTENHALREIDLVNESVRTLAGNGTKGSDYKGGGSGTTQVLNSPWDVCFSSSLEMVYIAMAGQHQIWEHNTSNGVTRSFSGDGFERNMNGSSSTNTSFAQPSGISFSPDTMEIYVADSESSSIRALNLQTGGTRLLAGGDPVFSDNLFRFGDTDGVGSNALFQHPLGVLYGRDSQIYVADSYNHKIKKIDPMSKRVTTIAGTGHPGFLDGLALSGELSEPSGLIDVGNGRLLIADTNNNVIRYLENGELHTLQLKGVQPPLPKSGSLKRLRRRSTANVQTIKIIGGSSLEGNIDLKISVPQEYHFSKEARSKFNIETEPANALVIEPLDGYLSTEGFASLHFKRSSSMHVMGLINCKVYYCKEDEVCLYQSLAFEVTFQDEISDTTANADITIPFVVKPKASTGDIQLQTIR